MTTNRMGLEQKLSDGNLRDLSAFLMDSYTGSLDTLRYAYAAEAITELLACRKASKEPVTTQFKQAADLYEMQFDDGRTCAFHTDAAKAVQWLITCDGNKVQEYVKLERLQNALTDAQAAPTGWKLVPVEPTENMVVEGFESEPDSFFSNSDEWEAYKAMSGCEQAAHKAKLCWAAMIAAAPSVTNEP